MTLSNVVSDAATQTSGAIGATNNNTVSVNLNVQSILGITPTSASIQSVQFRGNFGNESQYVEITFEDGETFLIGQRNGSNSSIFQTDQFFPVKNISSLLKNIGGGSQGITIVFNPTSQINRRVFGMTNL